MIFEIIRPRSIENSDFEQFEYLMRWYGDNGAECLHMFYDAEYQTKISGEVVNLEDGDFVATMITSVTNSVNLHADDLSLNDYRIFIQGLTNRYMTRIKKDGSEERFAVNPQTVKYRLMDGRYQLDFTIIPINKKVWK